jgi:hypothetical protein
MRMHVHTAQPSPMIGYAISAVVILLVMAFRFRSMNRVQPLRPERLWIVPVLYGVFAVTMFVQHPPPPLGWALSAGALAIGAVLGWHRGKTMRIGIDPATHALNQTQSPAAMIFIVVLLVARMGARSLLTSQAHVGAMMVTGALIALALGVIAASRAEMFLRARRLLADTRRAIA